jgi:hypothetical protein
MPERMDNQSSLTPLIFKLAHLIYGVITSGKPFDLQKALPRLDFQDGI